MLTLLMLLVACDRPTDEYPVRLHGAGTQLEDIQSAPSAMSGRVELCASGSGARTWGTGSRVSSGTHRVRTEWALSWARPTLDTRRSRPTTVPPPSSAPGQRPPIPAWSEAPHDAGPVEYVDVGDRVRFSSPVATHISLERIRPSAALEVRAGMWATGTSSCRMFRGIPISRTHGHRAPRGR